MIGTDVIDIAQIGNAVKNERFLPRVFNPSEREYIEKKNNSLQTVAGLFACKEAVLKALGTGINDGTTFRDITIEHDGFGRPYVTLTGRSQVLLDGIEGGGCKMYVSISHSDTVAVAVAYIK